MRAKCSVLVMRECGCSYPKDRGHDLLKEWPQLPRWLKAIWDPLALPWPSKNVQPQTSGLAIVVVLILAADLSTAQRGKQTFLLERRCSMGQPSPHLAWVSWPCRPRDPAQLYASAFPLGAQVTSGNEVLGLNFNVYYLWITWYSRHCTKCFSCFMSCNPLNSVRQVWLAFPFSRWGNCGLQQ